MAYRYLMATGVVTVSVLIGATACGEGAAGTGDSSGGTTKSIQFVNPLPNYPAWKAIGDCLADQADERGIDFTETGPTGQAIDTTTMIHQVQQAIASNKGAIITLPASDAFAPLLKQAQQKGIVTETFYGSDDPEAGADVNVGVDWTTVGERYVDAIAERPGEQNVGLMAASDTGLGKAWIDGMKAAAEKTSNVNIVGEVYTGDDTAKALPQTNALLAAHPETNVIATHMGTVTQGAVSVIESEDKVGDVVLVGNGPDNGGKEALASGVAYRMLVQDLCRSAEDGLNAVADRLEGKDARADGVESIEMGAKMASKDDIDSLLNKGWG